VVTLTNDNFDSDNIKRLLLQTRVMDVMMKKVYEFHQACIKDIERQIEVQKIYVNSGHPVNNMSF
jgi:hypothetical protein